MPPQDSILSAHALTVNVPGRTLVADLEVAFRPGEFVAVLGQNGAGKSLTLHTLAGLRAPDTGTVNLRQQDLATLKRAEIAQALSLLTQTIDDIFPATVLETALIGRHPHIGQWQWESPRDREIAAAALQQVDIAGLADRDVLTLSGGERRRLAIAQILTQDPDCYLLDEPTNHLDPQHQLDVLQLFREKARSGSCVVASLHDVNLAARFADRCLLLYGDGRWELGSCSGILTDARLSELYGTPMEALAWRDQQLFIATGGV